MNFIEINKRQYLDSINLNLGTYNPVSKFMNEKEINAVAEKMVLPKIDYKGKTIIFAADLVPTVGHIPIPYLMGYDIRPLVTMKEKELLLNDAAKNGFLLFMQHDAHNEVVSLKNTEKGVCLDQSISLKNLYCVIFGNSPPTV